MSITHSTLERPISPPPISSKRQGAKKGEQPEKCQEYPDWNGEINKRSEAATPPSLAAIEAGQAKIRNHLEYFSVRLSQLSKPIVPTQPRLTIPEFVDLYERNQHSKGRHFVVHQHNHPIAGVHYDLRLQFSQTSTVSFAIPYGLPGNANSRRQGRLAIETRVHNLWNNLIESASHATGSLLIWDTGEYTVLPRRKKAVETDDEFSNTSEMEDDAPSDFPESEKLVRAFQSRYIRLRLHGARLPRNYTITLRLPSANDTVQTPNKPKRRRRYTKTPAMTGSDTSDDNLPRSTSKEENSAIANASDTEEESSTIFATNAYTGATNSIGSIHQRHWFMTLDRVNSGFVKARSGETKGEWVPSGPGKGFQPFFVQGAEIETSVITGKTSEEIMKDEGVEGFKGRGLWRAVLE
jgi:hypothetical protein